MIFGIGTDIVEIDRIERLLSSAGERFLARIYTAEEREYCNKMARRAANYAARFAAKEAFVKALGTGFSQGISWRDISVRNESSGKPTLAISGKALEIMTATGITAVNVSLSHCQSHAVSIVTLEADQ